MSYFENEDDLKSPGDFAWRSLNGEIKGMVALCPKCGLETWLNVDTSWPIEVRWEWDNNIEKPTISPSILNLCCKWHGYLRNGNWEEVYSELNFIENKFQYFKTLNEIKSLELEQEKSPFEKAITATQDALLTEEGRQRLAESMANPIKSSLLFEALCRRAGRWPWYAPY